MSDHNDQSINDSPETSAPGAWKPQTTPSVDPLVASILLPKKQEAPRVRENAGALYAQETQAAAEGFAAAAAAQPQPLQSPRIQPAPEPESVPGGAVPTLQTYQRDIQQVVAGGDVSVVSIAAAEAARRSKTGAPKAETSSQPERSLLSTAMIIIGIMLLLGAALGVAYVVSLPSTVPLPQNIPSPFISVDATTVVPLDPASTPEAAIQTLQTARSKSDLSVGLVERLLVTIATTTQSTPQEMDASTFLSVLAPNAPSMLVRSVSGRFVLGVHSFAQNQPFLLFHTDSYEETYSGMLQWEGGMQRDLSTLFVHEPLKQLGGHATSTAPQFLDTPFIDAIIANHDARVLQNDAGDILLLWTFLDRHTLLITTNDGTVKELLTRLTAAPVSSTP